MDWIGRYKRQRIGKRDFGRATNLEQPIDIHRDINKERRRDKEELERYYSNRER